MKRFLKYIFLTFSLLSVQFIFAQTPTWQNITPPGWSGTFNFVENFTGNGLVAIANNGYFYHSLDTGHTWTAYPKPVDTVSCLTLYPDHKRAYLCGNSHLYKTTDAAVSWQEIKWTGMPSNIDLGRIYIKTEDSLLVAATDGVNGMKIYLSPDKGQTWVLVGTNLYGTNPVGFGITGFYFVTSAHGYALGMGYYAETTDGGHSWTQYNLDQNMSFNSILEISGHPTIISINKPSSASLPILNNSIFFKGGISKIIQAGTMLYGVYDKNFFSSPDSGKTWNIKAIDANKIFNSITFFDQLTGVIVGNYLTTYFTIDGGKTWTKSVYGGAEGFNKIYCKSKDECYITGNTGRLFHTIDGGTTWNYRDLYTSTLHNVVFPTIDTGFVSASGMIFRSIDGGQNWASFTKPTGGDFIAFPTKDTGYAGYTGTYPYMEKTTDAGETWTILGPLTGSGGAAFRSASEGLVSGSNNLLYTKDGGDTWQTKANGIVASAIIPIKNNWLVINVQSVYLCDKNINCILKHSINSNYSLGIPVERDSNTIYLYQSYEYGNTTLDSVLISKDGGNTWTSVQDTLSMWWMASFGDRNNICSIGLNSIYKGIFKSQTTSSIFSQIDNQTLSCTIINDANENYTASILLINSSLDTIIINKNILIYNGTSISIKIPNTVQIGTDYKIIIQPIDTVAFSSVISQSFTLTDIGIIETAKTAIIKVIGKSIVCNNSNYTIFNMLGQRMQNNTELPNGIYIVKCNNVTQKVIIKP